MKKRYYLASAVLICLTGCGQVDRMTCLINETTQSIQCNTCAVQQSTKVIRENAQLIDKSNRVLEENKKGLQSMGG